MERHHLTFTALPAGTDRGDRGGQPLCRGGSGSGDRSRHLATIFASCYLDDDAGDNAGRPSLQRASPQRRQLRAWRCAAQTAWVSIRRLPGCGLPAPHRPGVAAGWHCVDCAVGVRLGALSHNDRRLGFTLAVSTGMEHVTSVADYMDWALDQPQTKVIGLFVKPFVIPPGFRVARPRRGHSCGCVEGWSHGKKCADGVVPARSPAMMRSMKRCSGLWCASRDRYG